VVNRLLVLPERGKFEVMIGNWSTYEQRVGERERAKLAAEEEARKQARREARLRAADGQENAATPDESASTVGLVSIGRLERRSSTARRSLPGPRRRSAIRPCIVTRSELAVCGRRSSCYGSSWRR